MKKITLFLIAILLTLDLTACDPADFYYSYNELKENVETIELINYDNPDVKGLDRGGGYGCNAKRVSKRRDSLLPFDFEKMEIIEALPTEKMDNFFRDLSKVHFFWDVGHTDSPYGKCIRIIYKNGDFEIIQTFFRFPVGENAL